MAEVERQGRVKIGERKKKELIQRIFGEQGHPDVKNALVPEEQPQEELDHHQLLLFEIVRGDRSGSGKRKRGSRGGRWVSWIGGKSSRGDARLWRPGLRRAGKDGEQQVMDMDMDLPMVGMMTENETGMNSMEIGSNMDDIVANKDIDWLARQLVELRVSRHGTSGLEHWEMSSMEWLNNVAMSAGGDLLRDFVRIDGLKKEQATFERFGEEIRAHQFLENELDCWGYEILTISWMLLALSYDYDQNVTIALYQEHVHRIPSMGRDHPSLMILR